MLRSLEPGSPDPDPGLGTDRAMVQLGRVDLPELQRVAELVWSPLEHGHLGLIGAGAGGRDAAVALAVESASDRRGGVAPVHS